MISIIIATYNSSKTLRIALQSVLEQTYQNWECIVVDGASKDDTIAIVHEFEKKDSRFRHVSEPDKGIYDAYNKGWKMAKGEWVYYLGSDDILFADGLEKLIQTCQDADIVYGDMCYKRKVKEKYKKSPVTLKLGDMISHQSLVMKRELLEKMDGFDESYRICADFDLIQRCILQNVSMQYVDVYVAIFSTEGLTGSKTDNLKEAYLIKRKYHVGSKLYLLLNFGVKYIKKKFIGCLS